MGDKAIAKVPVCAANSTFGKNTNSNSNGGFDFFTLPFFGPSVLCIIIIGGPRGFYKFAKGFGQQMKTQILKNTVLKKIDSGGSGKPLLIPVAYGGIEGLLSAFRGVDDDMNVLAAGTLTGLLYKAFTGSLQSCGVGGLGGLLLSSLYCSLKPRIVPENVKKVEEYGNDKYHDECLVDDDFWKPN